MATDNESNRNSTNEGLPAGWTRCTFIVRTEHLEKIKALSFWSKTPMKAIFDKALDAFLAPKKIKPIPTLEDEIMDEPCETPVQKSPSRKL